MKSTLSQIGLHIHINLSVKQIDLLDIGLINQILDKYPNLRFAFDIDHRQVEDLTVKCLQKIRALQEQGVEFIMDNIDSLNKYQKLNQFIRFNCIKLLVNTTDAAAIIQNAQKMAQIVILKNIESNDQLNFANKYHIRNLQGYAIAKPMSTTRYHRYFLEANKR